MKLVDTNRKYLPTLPGTPPVLHVATIHDNAHEYICFYFEGCIYVEEIIGGSLHMIKSDEKHQEIVRFLEFKGILDGSKPLLPDDWKKVKP